MNQDWKIRVESTKRTPYHFMATFVGRNSGVDERSLEVRYLYGDGDLAVMLEDLGAGAPEIFGLIRALENEPSAEISVNVTEESMEMLSRKGPGRREGSA